MGNKTQNSKLKIQKDEKGLVYVFTGEGKGKTSAAIGTAVRAVGAGMKVGWVSWYKQDSWGLSELEPLQKLGVEMWLMGKGFHIESQNSKVKIQNENVKVKMVGIRSGGVVVDKATKKQHERAAREAVKKASEVMEKLQASGSKQQALLVLDEVNNAITDGLIDLTELIDLISKREATHIVITGRHAHKQIVEVADLVTECVKIKHPYDEGRLAVRGLDY